MEKLKNKVGNLEFGFDDSDKAFKVACRLCGEVWSFPSIYRDVIDAGWECPICKRKWEEIHGRDTVSY